MSIGGVLENILVILLNYVDDCRRCCDIYVCECTFKEVFLLTVLSLLIAFQSFDILELSLIDG